MQVWNVVRVARWKCRTQKSPKIRHVGTFAQLCRATSSQLRHVLTIGKKLVKQQYLLHMSPQYAKLQPTSGWDRFSCLGHPCKFQRVRVLAALLHGSLVVGVSQTLRCWTEGATYIRQGGHHVGHWPTFLVMYKTWNDDDVITVMADKPGLLHKWHWFIVVELHWYYTVVFTASKLQLCINSEGHWTGFQQPVHRTLCKLLCVQFIEIDWLIEMVRVVDNVAAQLLIWT